MGISDDDADLLSRLYPSDKTRVEPARIDNVIHRTVFVAHVSLLVLAWPEADGRDAHTDRCHSIGAEVPEIVAVRLIAEIGPVGSDTRPCQLVIQVDLPGQMEGLISDIHPGPGLALQCSHLPGRALAGDQVVHFLLFVIRNLLRALDCTTILQFVPPTGRQPSFFDNF